MSSSPQPGAEGAAALSGGQQQGVALARALLKELKRRGYLLALVARTRPGTYRNVLRQHGL